MNPSPYLQSYVSPICRFVRNDKSVQVEQLHGTGFLIANPGIFLTAHHVLVDAFADAKKNGGEVGVFPLQNIGGKKQSLTVVIKEFEAAPAPYDVAIFRNAQYTATTPFRFRRGEFDETRVWQEVATMGYPISVANKASNGQYELQQRAHRGYVQRKIPPGRLQPGDNPECLELSFAITNGLSGSPLFIHVDPHDDVIGVCIGSHQSRIVQYENRSFEGQGEKFSEKSSE